MILLNYIKIFIKLLFLFIKINHIIIYISNSKFFGILDNEINDNHWSIIFSIISSFFPISEISGKFDNE